MAAPSPDAAYPSALCRTPGPRTLAAPIAGNGLFGLLEIGFPASHRHMGQGPPEPRSSRGARARHAVGRKRAGIFGFLRRRPPPRADRRAARPSNENGKLEGFFNAAIDAALVLQTFILAAETAGLGCCPISVIRNHADAVADILGLPDKVFPVAGLCVGYPAAAGHVSMRLPLAATVHIDHYDERRLAEACRCL